MSAVHRRESRPLVRNPTGHQRLEEQKRAEQGGEHHDLVEHWEAGEATIAEARVTYTRADGSTVTVPVVTIYRAGGAHRRLH